MGGGEKRGAFGEPARPYGGSLTVGEGLLTFQFSSKLGMHPARAPEATRTALALSPRGSGAMSGAGAKAAVDRAARKSPTSRGPTPKEKASCGLPVPALTDPAPTDVVPDSAEAVRAGAIEAHSRADETLFELWYRLITQRRVENDFKPVTETLSASQCEQLFTDTAAYVSLKHAQGEKLFSGLEAFYSETLACMQSECRFRPGCARFPIVSPPTGPRPRDAQSPPPSVCSMCRVSE